ncbi:Zinc carboxypeptidase [Fodinibius sediminis]|uniref:Zinc carboxypeptidase n=2 Tax=Fodinibius sediminis TaxID=1214077 RepID=A0A521C988_9BACT|nr:Zinc carboxypeptidase [Fodinibius sediminis]
MSRYQLSWIILPLCMVLYSCKSSEEFTGYAYDPEGVTNTSDKEIQPQHKRTIGRSEEGIWISNEFKGARMNDFYKVDKSLYRVVIEPENHPINNSPWYAFKIHSESPRTVQLQLSYRHGEHRYHPNISRDGNHWRTMDPSAIQVDTAGVATLTLDLDGDPLWISAQELLTYRDMTQWMDSIRTASPTVVDTVGYSHRRYPILKMTTAPKPRDQKQGVLVITGRQHPPEVTGGLASRIFIETLTADTRLARAFRKAFEIWSYPLVNPDGVNGGHWRHNAAGVDLNRDWKNFNQPETRAIRDDLLTLRNDPNRKVYYGIDFHSTNENIFYPINRDITTFPDDFTYKWIEELKNSFPEMPLKVEPFPPNSPIAKNWIYHTFGADALTYEVDDRADRSQLREISRQAAQILMQNLLEAKSQQ